jgi:hypothetical protein
MSQKSSQKEAIVDMIEKLADVFKQYTRESRKRAWEKLISTKGKEEVKKILVDPYRPKNQFRQLALLNFKEWIGSEEQETDLDRFFNTIKQQTLSKFHMETGKVSFQFPVNYQSIMSDSGAIATIKMPQKSREARPTAMMQLAAHYDPLLETRPDEKELGAVKSLQTLADPGWNASQWNLFKKIIRVSARTFGAELGYLFEIEVFIYLVSTRKLEDRDDFSFGANTSGSISSFFTKRKELLGQISSKLAYRLGQKKQEAINLLHHMVLENAKDLGDQMYRRSQQILKCNPDQASFTGGMADWPDVRENPADIVIYCSGIVDQQERGSLGWNIKFTTEHKVHIASLGPLPAYRLLGGRGDKKFEAELGMALDDSSHATYHKDWRLAVIDLLEKPARQFEHNPSKFVSLLNDLISGVDEESGGRYDTLPAVVNYARPTRGGANWSVNMQRDFITTSDPKAKLKARDDADVKMLSNDTYVKLIYFRPKQQGSPSGTAITFEPRSERVIVKISNLTAGG